MSEAGFSQEPVQPKTQAYLELAPEEMQLEEQSVDPLTNELIGWDGASDRITAAGEMQPREQQLRRVLDSLFSFVGVLTPDGVLIEANRPALDAAQLQPQDVLGKPFWEAYWWSFSPESQAQLQTTIARAAQGESVRYDTQIRLAGDRFIIIDFALAPLLDSSGQVEYLIPSGVDITDRKQAEAALQHSQEVVQQQLAEIEAIYTSAPIGLCFLNTDLQFVRINERLAEINGLPVAEHLGRSLRQVLPEMADQLEPLYRQVIESGEPIINLEVRGTNQSQPGMVRDWLVCYYPQTRAEGQVIGVNVMVQEITERKRVELALSEANIQLESALAAGAIYTWRWEIAANQIITDRNFAQLFGLDPEAAATGLPAQQFVDAIHPDDRPQVLTAIDQAIATKADYAAEYRVWSSRGQYRWVLARGRVEYDEHGTAITFPGALADITDRKLAELNDQFLIDLDASLRQLTDADAMVWTAVSLLGQYLQVDRCIWHEVDLENQVAVLGPEWHSQDIPDMAGTYALSDLFEVEQIDCFTQGQPMVVANVANHPHTAPYADNYKPLTVVAFVAIPCIYRGRWIANLAVTTQTAREWRADEIALLQEVVARLWSLIEQTRAVQTLREREDRYRTLFESVNQGFCICELILDQAGTPYDYRFLEINPAFEAMSGLMQAVNKTVRELVPNLESFWVETTPVKVNVCSSFALTDGQLRDEDVWDHKHL